MGLITMLIRSLRMLLSTGGVFLTLGMVTLAMMFGGGTVGLGGVFVMFGCFVVFVSGHCKAPWLLAPSQPFKALRSELFLHFCNAIAEFVAEWRLLVAATRNVDGRHFAGRLPPVGDNLQRIRPAISPPAALRVRPYLSLLC